MVLGMPFFSIFPKFDFERFFFFLFDVALLLESLRNDLIKLAVICKYNKFQLSAKQTKYKTFCQWPSSHSQTNGFSIRNVFFLSLRTTNTRRQFSNEKIKFKRYERQLNKTFEWMKWDFEQIAFGSRTTKVIFFFSPSLDICFCALLCKNTLNLHQFSFRSFLTQSILLAILFECIIFLLLLFLFWFTNCI